jgi:transposase-like protein
MKKPQPRDKFIMLRASVQEKKTLARAAKKEGLKPSQYLRWILFGEKA